MLNQMYFCATLAAAAVLLCAVGGNSASGRSYSFTKIVDDTGSFVAVGTGRQSINAHGTVAFLGFQAGNSGIYTGNGGPVSPIIVEPPVHLSGPSINDAGTVAFWRQLPSSNSGIFAGNGGPLTTIATSNGPPFDGFGVFPTINASGAVAFSAAMDNGGYGIFTGAGGAITPMSQNTAPYDRFGRPWINASGAVAFSAAINDGSGHSPLHTAILTGDGTTNTVLVDDSGELSHFGDPSMNDHGAVAFVASLDSGHQGVFVHENGTTTTITDTSGPFSGFVAFLTVPLINNHGELAFFALLDDATPVDSTDNLRGIYTGPDPVLDKVIQTGDPLFGSNLTFISVNYSLNDSGQIAFSYFLANGTSGVAVATTVVPEPTAAALALLALPGLAWRRNRQRNQC